LSLVPAPRTDPSAATVGLPGSPNEPAMNPPLKLRSTGAL